VLHLLGLDHAGHVGGVHSATMARKQHEMDALVARLQRELERDEAAGRRPTALIVCSDHGMNDQAPPAPARPPAPSAALTALGQGNHGGGSDGETSATALLFHASTILRLLQEVRDVAK